MLMRNRVAAIVSVAALAAGTALAAAPAASAKPTSLADVLLADTTSAGAPSFDRNGQDFDILTAAVLTVLKKKPNSPVSVLTKANVKLTAFLPTDNGFRRTAKVLGINAVTEKRVATRLVQKLGVKTIESVLLYHVVPGARITAKMAAASDGAHLKTALGKSIRVDVRKNGIFLADANKAVRNPKIIATNINLAKGNVQIAHAINRVLLPI